MGLSCFHPASLLWKQKTALYNSSNRELMWLVPCSPFFFPHVRHMVLVSQDSTWRVSICVSGLIAHHYSSTPPSSQPLLLLEHTQHPHYPSGCLHGPSFCLEQSSFRNWPNFLLALAFTLSPSLPLFVLLWILITTRYVHLLPPSFSRGWMLQEGDLSSLKAWNGTGYLLGTWEVGDLTGGGWKD